MNSVKTESAKKGETRWRMAGHHALHLCVPDDSSLDVLEVRLRHAWQRDHLQSQRVMWQRLQHAVPQVHVKRAGPALGVLCL